VQEQLQEAIEAIRPALQSDGGDVRVLNLDEENGVVALKRAAEKASTMRRHSAALRAIGFST